MAKELHVDGRLYLVLDGDRQLEPGSNGSLRETLRGPDVAQKFGRLVNGLREDAALHDVHNVEVRDR